MRAKFLKSAAAVAALAITVTSGVSVATTVEVDELQFSVHLDGKEIGYHRFSIADRGDHIVVESKADFDVRLLFVPVYSYRHENKEVWRDGCLAQIASQTDANGTPYAVSGERRDGVFAIDTRQETRLLDRDCVMSFAYWNRDFLAQRQLLNAQTGELLDVSIESLGERELQLEGRAIPAEGFRIQAEGEAIDLTVWYAAADGRWLVLESTLSGGKTIRYLPAGAAGVVLADRERPAGATAVR